MHHKHKHTHTHVYTSQRRICIIDAYNRLTCAPAYKNMHICAHTHSHCWQMHTHKGYNEVKKYNSHGSSEAAGYASGAAWQEVGAARRQWRLRIIKFPTNNQQRTCTCVWVFMYATKPSAWLTCGSRRYVRLRRQTDRKDSAVSLSANRHIYKILHTQIHIYLSATHCIFRLYYVCICEESLKYF